MLEILFKSNILLKLKAYYHSIAVRSAYTCSEYKSGCDFKVDFATIKEKAAGKEITKALVWEILND
ncbi:hypothetical protein QVZ41_05540 [Wenyingzhuangia sp. chi5]|uniref:Uncharacterized protein n=1 Tax=Wenyingzhuangia gilva TaxID=3057677 RepID=A0ABT8VQQ7_9FLAO|nr:hypothetical protein [Wenyingzhuangia sp. chi5]MDO3694308.1 hypothetical protein [Wenyingzhuangia sp. chi5]